MKRKRNQEQKTAPKKKWSKQKKKKVLIISISIAVVLLLFLMFWTPAGTVKTWFGKPMFISNDTILATDDSHYYALGTFTLPDGFTEASDYRLSSDAYRFEMKASPQEENSTLDYFYMSALASPDVERIHSTFSSMYENCSDLQTMDICGKTAQWFEVSYEATTGDSSSMLHNICIYIPAGRGSLLLSLYSPKVNEKDLPTTEEMLANIDLIVSDLTLQ